MSAADVDAYLEALPKTQRDCLERLRREILRLVPSAEEVISYRIPAFRIDGGVVAGFAAMQSHLGYYPFSGSTLAGLADHLAGRSRTKSALHFSVEDPLPASLVRRLVRARLAEIRRVSGARR